jgi:dihydrofolate synthase/folylpolyglutamate synthase
LGAVDWPGRLQLITRPGGQRVLLDGAHNVAGTEALCDALQDGSIFSGARPASTTLILGAMGDKDWRRICELLAPRAQRIIVVPLASVRSAAPAALAEVCRQVNRAASVAVSSSSAQALERSADDEFIVVTGSLYLVGEALAWLSSPESAALDEKTLNDWRPAGTGN